MIGNTIPFPPLEIMTMKPKESELLRKVNQELISYPPFGSSVGFHPEDHMSVQQLFFFQFLLLDRDPHMGS